MSDKTYEDARGRVIYYEYSIGGSRYEYAISPPEELSLDSEKIYKFFPFWKASAITCAILLGSLLLGNLLFQNWTLANIGYIFGLYFCWRFYKVIIAREKEIKERIDAWIKEEKYRKEEVDKIKEPLWQT